MNPLSIVHWVFIVQPRIQLLHFLSLCRRLASDTKDKRERIEQSVTEPKPKHKRKLTMSHSEAKPPTVTVAEPLERAANNEKEGKLVYHKHTNNENKDLSRFFRVQSKSRNLHCKSCA